MSIGNKLGVVALAAALGGLIVPAIAENAPGGMQNGPDQGMSMGQMGGGMMGGGMMSGGMMSPGMMARGCSEMMQSMNNGADGRPNSQWQKQTPGDAPPN